MEPRHAPDPLGPPIGDPRPIDPYGPGLEHLSPGTPSDGLALDAPPGVLDAPDASAAPGAGQRTPDGAGGYAARHVRRRPGPGEGERPASAVAGAALVAGLLVLLVVSAVFAARVAGERTSPTDLRAPDAVLLGLVEGVTEWLPISSTGHLTVTQNLLGLDGPVAESYAIAIQAGAILAVLGLYRERFAAMVEGARGRDPVGRRTLTAVLVAAAPAVAVGLVLEGTIKDHLFGGWPVAVAWAVGGMAILVVARGRRDRSPIVGAPVSALMWDQALVIGIFQVLALWPGVSRSLVTILGATAVGLAVPAAVEFSFLLGFVTLGGATAYETLSSGRDMVDAYGLGVPVLGLVVAFVSAVVAMRWMVGYLNRHGLGIFGWYRIGVALLLGGLLVSGVV